MGGRQLLSGVNKCRHWLLPGIQGEGNAVQLKEALDFCVACCPELKLPGCSQGIYASLQVVQSKRRRKKKVDLASQAGDTAAFTPLGDG